MTMRYLATGLVTLLLSLPALSVELFQYRCAAKDGGTLEYVFEAGEQNSQRRNQTLRYPSKTTTVSKRSRHSPFGFESSFFSSGLGFSFFDFSSSFGFSVLAFSSALGFSTSVFNCCSLGFSTSALCCSASGLSASAFGCSTFPLLTGRSPSLLSPLPGR